MLNCSQGGHEQAPGGCYFRSELPNLSVLCLVFCWCIQSSCCMASLNMNPYSANSVFSIILKCLIYKSLCGFEVHLHYYEKFQDYVSK